MEARMENKINLRAYEITRYFCIKDYQPEWKTLAEQQMEKINHALAEFPWFKGITHIGSTAVPGMAAKPVIDLMIGIDESINIGVVRDELSKMGFWWHARNPFCAYYTSHPDVAIGIFITIHNDYAWKGKIKFRDHLLSNPQDVEGYIRVKKSAIGETDNFYDYTLKKQDYIASIMARIKGGSDENH
jgi:GrpB-like predicted nucleotidyltransferase (UPF0157 family)